MRILTLDLVYHGRHKFHLTLQSKTTILCGYSASGKTTITDLATNVRLADYADYVHELVYNRNGNVDSAISEFADGDVIFVGEETLTTLILESKLSYLWSKPYWFVFVTRVPITDIQYSYRDVYTLETKGNTTKAVHLYKEFNTLPKCNSYAVEDELSGFEYFSSFLNVKTFGGNLNWKEGLCAECLIMDGACVGQLMHSLVKRSVDLYLPESFEFLLLQYYCNYTHEDAINDLSDEKTFEQLYDNLTLGDGKLGFTYSKGYKHCRAYLARLIPELEGLPNKRLLRYLKESEVDKSGDKKLFRPDLNVFLGKLGLLQYYEEVLDKLPDQLDGNSWAIEVIYALHDLGVKEFQ